MTPDEKIAEATDLCAKAEERLLRILSRREFRERQLARLRDKVAKARLFMWQIQQEYLKTYEQLLKKRRRLELLHLRKENQCLTSQKSSEKKSGPSTHSTPEN